MEYQPSWMQPALLGHFLSLVNRDTTPTITVDTTIRSPVKVTTTNGCLETTVFTSQQVAFPPRPNKTLLSILINNLYPIKTNFLSLLFVYIR